MALVCLLALALAFSPVHAENKCETSFVPFSGGTQAEQAASELLSFVAKNDRLPRYSAASESGLFLQLNKLRTNPGFLDAVKKAPPAMRDRVLFLLRIPEQLVRPQG